MTEPPIRDRDGPGARPTDPALLTSWILAAYRARLAEQQIEFSADEIVWVKWQRHADRVLAECLTLLGVPDATQRPADLSGTSAAVLGGKPFVQLENPVDLLRAISVFVEVASDALVTFLVDRREPASVPAILQILTNGAMAAINIAATWYGTLLSQSEQIEAGERRRLARDLHDWMGSGISLAVRQLELYETYRADGRSRQARAQIPRTRVILEDLLARTSALVQDLAPEPGPVSLALRLKNFARQMNTPGMTVEVRVYGDEAVLPDRYREALFLVLREALRNALIHSSGRNILVEAKIQGRDVRATVDDDGVGLDLAGRSGAAATGGGDGGGHGLTAMRERIKILGGELFLVNKPARGLRVEIHVPLPERHVPDSA